MEIKRGSRKLKLYKLKLKKNNTTKLENCNVSCSGYVSSDMFSRAGHKHFWNSNSFTIFFVYRHHRLGMVQCLDFLLPKIYSYICLQSNSDGSVLRHS